MSDQIDWDEATTEVKDAFKKSFGHLLRGAGGDIEDFLETIAKDTVDAVKLGRTDLVAELKAQVRTMGENRRLQTSSRMWDLTEEVVGVAGGLAAKIVKSYLPMAGPRGGSMQIADEPPTENTGSFNPGGGSE